MMQKIQSQKIDIFSLLTSWEISQWAIANRHPTSLHFDPKSLKLIPRNPPETIDAWAAANGMTPPEWLDDCPF